MTTTWETCAFCGDVELTPEDMVLLLPNHDATEGQYQFECPREGCGAVNTRQADKRLVSKLLACGVRCEVELSERDIERFVEEISSDDNVGRKIKELGDEKD